MLVLTVLLLSWAVLRAAGSFGVKALATWRAARRGALALMLVFTASAHFTPMNQDLVKMVPEWMPRPMEVVYATGVLELAGAAGMVLPATRRLSGVMLCVLFVAMFPANVKAARQGLTLGGSAATGLWLRVPMQVLFVWLAWWSTRTKSG
jgi:uncharacterized membrane protein